MNKNTVATVVVVVIAICLIGVVVGRNYINVGDDTTTSATKSVETTIDKDGNVIFLTAPDGYTSPSSKSSMIYHGSTKLTTSTTKNDKTSDKTQSTASTSATTTKPSETRIEYVTDEIGNAVLDENGKPMTTVVIVTTKPTTTDSTTVPDVSENTDSTATTSAVTDTTQSTTAQSTTQTDTSSSTTAGQAENTAA